MVDNNSNKEANGEQISVFKQVYTRHKRQGKNPNRIDDLLREDGGVIDVSRLTTFGTDSENERKPLPDSTNQVCFGADLVTRIESVLSTQTPRKCSGFGFREFPGVYLYPQALDPELQTRLAYEAVTEYCELTSSTKDANPNSTSNSSSHRTNIDLLPPKAHERVNQLDNPDETMWNLWKQTKGKDSNLPKAKRAKHHHSNPQGLNNLYRRFSKLSWATMGYHYDWTERSYHPQTKSNMPDLVARISTLFATAANSSSTPSTTSFCPSASIVNYYTTKSTMGGHRDDLEDAMDKPIVSISLGLPGIFVLGGPTKDETTKAAAPHPVRALLLRPGDVLVMGGPSRLNYHAMARVLPHEAALEYHQQIIRGKAAAATTTTTTMQHHQPCANLSLRDLSLGEGIPCGDEKDFLVEYLKHHRVNINVRQVYPDE